MKVLHTSDIHLKEYNDDRWNALISLLETAKKESIDLFVISGDLFDKNVNAEFLRQETMIATLLGIVIMVSILGAMYQ